MNVEFLSRMDLCSSIIFVVLVLLLIFPTDAVICSGLTLENVFSFILGLEKDQFILYHVKRSTLTVIIHSFIPLLYYIMLILTSETILPFKFNSSFIELFVQSSILLPIFIIGIALFWHQNNWEKHPIMRKIKYQITGTDEDEGWKDTVKEINAEVNSFDKFVSGGSYIRASNKLIITENWIIKTSLYTIDLAHQSKVSLVIEKTDSICVNVNRSGDDDLIFQMAQNPNDINGAQILRMAVVNNATKNTMFHIHINSSDYENIKGKLSAPIKHGKGVIIQMTLADEFVEQFKKFVAVNPIPSNLGMPTDYTAEPCIGCGEVDANTKIILSCAKERVVASLNRDDNNHIGADEVPRPIFDEQFAEELPTIQNEPCGRCLCRPMWCISCLGRWFASRQLVARKDSRTWMSQKATCPNCRAVFCVLDVVLLPES